MSVTHVVTSESPDVVERVATPVTSRVVEVRTSSASRLVTQEELEAERQERITADESLLAAVEMVDRPAYTHHQAEASSSWTVVHGLGFNPNIVVLDSAGSRISGEDVTYEDVNTLTLSFAIPFGGTAYLS